MKHETSLIVILFSINLLLPGMVKGAESLQKIRVGLPSLALTYETLVSMFNKDGRLPPKVARGYLDLLRQERSVPADLDPQKFVDFSMLPGGK